LSLVVSPGETPSCIAFPDFPPSLASLKATHLGRFFYTSTAVLTFHSEFLAGMRKLLMRRYSLTLLFFVSVSALSISADTLGLSSTKIWLTHADKGLAVALGKIAHITNLPLEIVNVDNVGSADSESFREKKIPAITIHSVTQETWPILHSKKDKLEAIKLDDYYKTYQLLSAYIVMLDQGLDQPAPPAATAAGPAKTQ
jgi:hypothetical protein